MCHSLSLAHRGSTLPQRIISFSLPFLVSGMLTHQIFSFFHVLLLCFSIVLSYQSSLASVRVEPKCVLGAGAGVGVGGCGWMLVGVGGCGRVCEDVWGKVWAEGNCGIL